MRAFVAVRPITSLAMLASPGFIQSPLQAPVASSQRLADPKLEQLKQMFPEIEMDVLTVMLSFHNGNVEETVAAILDAGPPEASAATQEDLDAVVARGLQEEMDAEVARSVHAEMQAEDEARRAQDPTVRAAVAVEKAGTMAMKGAQSLLQRPIRPLSARKSTTHAVRLLDAPADDSGASAAFDFTPLQLPAYTPNYAPPASQAPASQAQPAPDISDDDPFAQPEPATEPSNVSRYSARLDRARSANQLRARTSSYAGEQAASPPQPSTPPAAHVPEGELI